uniref:Uncharacterized protein n=1 Tax=Oryza nivara TaxID=4536 RepID=A0A0E0ITR3_ORYNI
MENARIGANFQPIKLLQAPATNIADENADDKNVRELLDMNPHKNRKQKAIIISDDITLPLAASIPNSSTKKRTRPLQASPTAKKLFTDDGAQEKEATDSLSDTA